MQKVNNSKSKPILGSMGLRANMAKNSVANLRRRLVSLDILERPSEELQQEHCKPSKPLRQTKPKPQKIKKPAAPREESDPEEEPDFVPGGCLFCPQSSPTLDQNVAHMQKAHGLFIPDRDRLIVDLEALIRYLHVVIFRYRECLYCHTERRSIKAVQQHMIGKSHCKFDINDESEFADFYADYVDAEEDDQDWDEERDTTTDENGKARRPTAITQVDITTARLASGKLFSHRSATQASRQGNQYRRRIAQLHPRPPEILAKEPPAKHDRQQGEGVSASIATNSQKREIALMSQLENLSINDRAALAHLPSAEQRSLISTQYKQLNKAKEADKRSRTRLELMANSVKRSNFRSDVVAHDRRKNWNA